MERPNLIVLNEQQFNPLRSPFGPTPPPLCLIKKPDRGLALITTASIKPGQVVLVDSPLVVYPSMASLPLFCSHCFRVLPSEPLPCTKCNVARFCSPRCLSLSHPSLLCHALPSLTTGNYKMPSYLIFLLSAYSLPPFSLCLLLSLHSNASLSEKTVELLHAQITSLISGQNPPLLFSYDNSYSLLCKENNNSFYLPLPRDQIQRFRDAGITSGRACGLYLWASMVNHDCMPNVCRFHYIDDPQLESNTHLIFRALHGITKGSEICTSYVNFEVAYRDRQDWLLRKYDFQCDCYRCVIESDEEAEEEGKIVKTEDTSKEKETGEKNEVEEAKVGEGEQEQEQEMSDGSEGDVIISDYHNEYICECGGFVAPLAPSQDGALSDSRECNGCGIVRKDAVLDNPGNP